MSRVFIYMMHNNNKKIIIILYLYYVKLMHVLFILIPLGKSVKNNTHNDME